MMIDKTGKWKLEIKRGGERRVKRKSESRGSRWSPSGQREGVDNRSIAGMAASGRPLNWIRVANPRARTSRPPNARSPAARQAATFFFWKVLFSTATFYIQTVITCKYNFIHNFLHITFERINSHHNFYATYNFHL